MILDGCSIILESESKNTASSLVYGCLLAQSFGYSKILCVTSDHVVDNEDAFVQDINDSLGFVKSDKIIIFGTKLYLQNKLFGKVCVKETVGKVAEVVAFTEKQIPEKSDYSLDLYTNSGMICGYASTLLLQMEKYQPDLYATAKQDFENCAIDSDIFVIQNRDSPSVSIDFGLLDHCDVLEMYKIAFCWIDVGSWDSIKMAHKSQKTRSHVDLDVNAIVKQKFNQSDNILTIDSENTFIFNKNNSQKVIVSNLKTIDCFVDNDLIVISDSRQGLGVVREKLKTLAVCDESVNDLLQNNNYEKRQWGHFEVIARSGKYLVKKLVLKPKHSTSLQSHNCRSEYWVVAEGNAKITINNLEKDLLFMNTVSVPVSCKYKISNYDDKDLVIIEVQYGDTLKENDITRYQEK